MISPPQAKPQFAKILNLISHDTARFFMHLLTPEVSKAVSVKGVNLRTQVVGDADGSISRTLLAGINSGHITLEEPELKLLAEVMDAEAKASEAYDNKDDTLLEAFQKDEAIANKLDQIIEKANFKEGNSKLVFIGDILHDRFSNNKQAMKTLIEKLHDKGAIFITGNHDVYDEVNPDNTYQMNDEDRRQHYITEEKRIGQESAKKNGDEYTSDNEQQDLEYAEVRFNESKGIKLQNGFHGARQITKEDSDQLLKKCFKNAYLDENTSMLYTHNGFQHSGVGNVYMTAFGFIRANNADELAEKMNTRDFNDTTRGYEAIQNEFGDQDFKSQFLEQKNLEKLGILIAPSASEKKVNQDSDPNITNDVKFRKELDDAGIDKKGGINKTNFRPKDYDMMPQALGVAGKRADGRDVTIVHGHNDIHSQTTPSVQNLNARSPQGVSPITRVY